MEIHSIRGVDATKPGIPAASPVPPEQRAENRELFGAVKAVNETELLGYQSELAMFVDRETHRPVVRVINKETREVIRQIPSEDVLNLARMVKKLEEGKS